MEIGTSKEVSFQKAFTYHGDNTIYRLSEEIQN